MIAGVFAPWLVFDGNIHHVLIGTYRVSGFVSGFGHGTLDSTGAGVTVWSSETRFSTESSDFWFGLLPLVGGLMNLLMAWRIKEVENSLIPVLTASISCALAVIGYILVTVFYDPQVFTINGQIDDLIINGAILYERHATIKIGLGPLICLVAGFLSSIALVATSQVIKPD